MKKMMMAGVLVAMVSGAAMGAFFEDFESYDYGTFQGQASPWQVTSPDWRIVEYYGQKALKIVGPTTDNILTYTGQQFANEGEGYTVMMMMFCADTMANYGGWSFDRDSEGNGRRFCPDGNGSVGSPYGEPGLYGNGAGPMTWYREVYWRMYRQGDSIKIWNSLSPITAQNPGTLMLEGTLNNLVGEYFGLYGVYTAYYDNVLVHEGNYIPEPATMALLALGGVFGLRRRS